MSSDFESTYIDDTVRARLPRTKTKEYHKPLGTESEGLKSSINTGL